MLAIFILSPWHSKQRNLGTDKTNSCEILAPTKQTAMKSWLQQAAMKVRKHLLANPFIACCSFATNGQASKSENAQLRDCNTIQWKIHDIAGYFSVVFCDLPTMNIPLSAVFPIKWSSLKIWMSKALSEAQIVRSPIFEALLSFDLPELLPESSPAVRYCQKSLKWLLSRVKETRNGS